MHIHPLAAVSPAASIGSNVHIGPFCVVEPHVTIGDGCSLESHVVLKNGTTLGRNNQICTGVVLGGFPQHVDKPEQPGTLRIGDGNTFRENATAHRAMAAGHETKIGDNNFVMVNAHVAHDCCLGNHVILTNNVMLAGHVTVEDRAYIGGAAAVHQFCRVGRLAMVGGQAHLVKDTPPFVTIDGQSSMVVGLNQVGLRRAGHDLAAIRQLKAAYRLIYRSGLKWDEVLERLQAEFAEGPAADFHRFFLTTKRGITSERRVPPGATIKFRREGEAVVEKRRAQAG